jgi:hypothetical protein
MTNINQYRHKKGTTTDIGYGEKLYVVSGTTQMQFLNVLWRGESYGTSLQNVSKIVGNYYNIKDIQLIVIEMLCTKCSVCTLSNKCTTSLWRCLSSRPTSTRQDTKKMIITPPNECETNKRGEANP